MIAVNITDSNATVVLDTSSVFIQSHCMITFAQARHLILSSRFFVINMSNYMARLRS